MNIVSRSEALAQGLKRYFTGKACPAGHVVERATCNCTCFLCVSESHKKAKTNDRAKYLAKKQASYLRNKENYAQYGIRYAIENKEKIAERMRRWGNENKERNAMVRKLYRESNRDSVLAYGKSYRKANRDVAKAYYLKNKARYLHRNRMRQLRLIKAIPQWADVNEIRKFYKMSAAITTSTGVRHEVDHIVPLKGRHVCGLHVANNLRVITADMNAAKGNAWDSEVAA